MLHRKKISKIEKMFTFFFFLVYVGLQVVMILLSTWNLSLVMCDLPSFLGCFVMFCVLVVYALHFKDSLI